MRRLKYISYTLLFFLVITSISPAMAQAPSLYQGVTQPPSSSQPLRQPATSSSTNSNLDVIYGNVDPGVPKNLGTLTQTTIISVLSSTICILSGHDPLNPDGKCLGVDPRSGKIGYSQDTGGASQFMGMLIGGTATFPISSSDYTSYALSNFGITKKAFAQNKGQGFERLTPLVGVWSRFRDIAYLAFVLAFTVIGLAIMFRVKIDARTVMTIQNQIPKIVIALILVTLSYAIAGFLIDLMYVVMYLILITFSTLTPVHVNPDASIFSVANKAFNPSALNAANYAPGGGIMNLTFTVSRGIGQTFGSLTTDFLSNTISSLFKIFFIPFKALNLGCDVFSGVLSWGTIPGLLQKIPGVGDLLGNVPGFDSIFGGSSCDFVDTFFSGFFAFLFGAIAFLVVLITILYTLFRVWFTLIKSFIYVLVDAMIGPLWIGAGIFPGSKLGFSTWVRHLMGHLSVFPMTFAVILLGKTIMEGVASGQGQLFSPPLVGDAFAGNTFMAAIVGFGFIISLPTILDKTRKAIGAIDFGLADVKTAFGVSRGLGGKGISGSTGAAFGSKYELGPQGQTTAVSGPKRFLKGMLGR